ncbi:sugar ABC transporter permease [Vallitalea pronyensis]|uniref:Sugar ABC transporter permease n=1 Tax=Vallitalea pronyensis TaxID=1348613 RepID=A0A8J8MIY2_9FIRM|nr:sugar ABC transporter permease [Vallitalea pronyensis]QUI22297.1 sugar ABC transporter permease [Vallitalea pronyensis]
MGAKGNPQTIKQVGKGLRKGILTKKNRTLAQKRAKAGYLFVLPFIIGGVSFTCIPLIRSFIFSLSKLSITATGYDLHYVGFKNYVDVLTVDAYFRVQLFNSVKEMLFNLPLILIFSFFAASLLNQKFKGRTLARAFFFLPVILASGAILTSDTSSIIMQQITGSGQSAAEASDSMFTSNAIYMFLYNSGVSEAYTQYIVSAIDRIYDIVLFSGVQILVFLAGLQSISPDYYEASMIEGATKWENFWKITFPMVSPMILVNTIYTIIDSFVSEQNELIERINTVMYTNFKFGFGSAMAWVYFIVVFIILAIVTRVISKRVFYYD